MKKHLNYISFSTSGIDEKFKVFTTRPETLFGVSFIAISFESTDLLNRIVKEGSPDKLRLDAYL